MIAQRLRLRLRLLSVVVEIEETLGSSRRHRRISPGVSGLVKRIKSSVAEMMISVSLSGFISLALAAGVFIPARGWVLGFIPLALAAGVFIAFLVWVSALSAGNLNAIQASLFEPKQRSHGTGFLQKPDLVYIWLRVITVG